MSIITFQIRCFSALVCVVLSLFAGRLVAAEGAADRAYTVSVVTRVASPVLEAGAAGKLKQSLPCQAWEKDRAAYAELEAVGRTLAGIAPWLELGSEDSAEGCERGRLTRLAVRTVAGITDPSSPDYANFEKGSQPLVDAAFLALALLRAPRQLWGGLSEKEQAHVVAALKKTRDIKPYESNWLVFSATVEAALWHFTGECKREAIEYAVKRHQQWYVGDGTYGDGPEYHWDYYNSFVIQPMLLAVLDVCEERRDVLAQMRAVVVTRAQRYAAVQERLISPEGTYPVIGRSSTYRFGAFHHLSDMSLRHNLPADLSPASVRCALTAVIRRMLETPGTFDEQGWLQVGVVGHQPSARESYISTGSLYLCLFGVVHLGLPASDPLWAEAAQPWTQARLWSGVDVPADHASK